jgi:hypothetical protein
MSVGGQIKYPMIMSINPIPMQKIDDTVAGKQKIKLSDNL